MAREKCAVCGELGTPWESCKELGLGLHMCHDCAILKAEFYFPFQRYLELISDQLLDHPTFNHRYIEDLKPKTVKKLTYLLIRKWYNDRMKKGA